MIYKFGAERHEYISAPKIPDVVRINKETRPILEDAVRECYDRGINVSVCKLVSDMVAFAAENMRFEEG